MKHNNGKHNKGFSMIEALISTAIVGYVVVAILSGVSQQQMNTQTTTERNQAVMAAELRLEELLKFPSDRLVEETYTDYIVFKADGITVVKEGQTAPNQLRQFRRTTTISKEDLLGQLATIRVVVEYGAQKESVSSYELIYPFRVELSTRRSLK